MNVDDLIYLIGLKEARIYELTQLLEKAQHGDSSKPDDLGVMYRGTEERRSG